MACVPSDLKYSGNHEWVRPLGNGRVRMGITEYAQKKLGDPVYVQLPAAGSRWDAGDNFGYVESVKSINDLYLPVAGTIAAVNESLQESHFGAEQIEVDRSPPVPDLVESRRPGRLHGAVLHGLDDAGLIDVTRVVLDTAHVRAKNQG